MIDLSKIPNHPTYYQSQLSGLLDQCMIDLKNIILSKFDGHYKHHDGEDLLKVRSILGTPCINEIVVCEDGGLKCTYGFWNGQTFSVPNTEQLYTIPLPDLLYIYETIYKISSNYEI